MDWPFNETAERRFWAKVDKAGEHWLWTGKPGEDGYGQFRSGGAGSPTIRAHRAAWAFAHGEMPPDDMLVCHHCDIPLCCNPVCLFLGTPAQNSADMRAKGRQCRGEDHPNYGKGFGAAYKPEQRARGERNAAAKLTIDDIHEIRRLYALGARQVDLAAQFSTPQPNISAIVRRKAWAHVE